MARKVSAKVGSYNTVHYLHELLNVDVSKLPIIGIRTVESSKLEDPIIQYFILTHRQFGYIDANNKGAVKFLSMLLGSEKPRFYTGAPIIENYQETEEIRKYCPLTPEQSDDLQARLNRI
ncbi:hypothetical protein J4438_03135 [Candidatus Woesearchaeota archaeon]|nr:hypothetical protein [Candidatus Woesearchaeota archaeon]